MRLNHKKGLFPLRILRLYLGMYGAEGDKECNPARDNFSIINMNTQKTSSLLINLI